MMKKKLLKLNNQSQKIDWDSLTYRLIGIFIGLMVIWASNPLDMQHKSYFRGFLVSESARWVIACGGFIIILYNLLYKRSQSPSDITFYENTICPKCETAFTKGSTPPNSSCPKCKIQLERLEGFYNRHPELKNVEGETSSEETKE